MPFLFNGSRLRAAREAAGLRREHLAIATDRSAQSVRLWELGEVVPDAATVGKLATAVGVDPGALFVAVEP